MGAGAGQQVGAGAQQLGLQQLGAQHFLAFLHFTLGHLTFLAQWQASLQAFSQELLQTLGQPQFFLKNALASLVSTKDRVTRATNNAARPTTLRLIVFPPFETFQKPGTLKHVRLATTRGHERSVTETEPTDCFQHNNEALTTSRELTVFRSVAVVASTLDTMMRTALEK